MTFLRKSYNFNLKSNLLNRQVFFFHNEKKNLPFKNFGLVFCSFFVNLFSAASIFVCLGHQNTENYDDFFHVLLAQIKNYAFFCFPADKKVSFTRTFLIYVLSKIKLANLENSQSTFSHTIFFFKTKKKIKRINIYSCSFFFFVKKVNMLLASPGKK